MLPQEATVWVQSSAMDTVKSQKRYSSRGRLRCTNIWDKIDRLSVDRVNIVLSEWYVILRSNLFVKILDEATIFPMTRATRPAAGRWIINGVKDMERPNADCAVSHMSL